MTKEEVRNQVRQLASGEELVLAAWEAHGLRGILGFLHEDAKNMVEVLEANRNAGMDVDRSDISAWKRMATSLEKLAEQAKDLRDLT